MEKKPLNLDYETPQPDAGLQASDFAGRRAARDSAGRRAASALFGFLAAIGALLFAVPFIEFIVFACKPGQYIESGDIFEGAMIGLISLVFAIVAFRWCRFSIKGYD